MCGKVRLQARHCRHRSSSHNLLPTLPQVTAIMGQLAKNVPMHTWLAALPQLISRVCHPCKEVSELAKSIIVRITQVGGKRARSGSKCDKQCERALYSV